MIALCVLLGSRNAKTDHKKNIDSLMTQLGCLVYWSSSSIACVQIWQHQQIQNKIFIILLVKWMKKMIAFFFF